MKKRWGSVLFAGSLCMLSAAAFVLMGCNGSSDDTPASSVTNPGVVPDAPLTRPNVYGEWSGPRNGIQFQMHIDQIDSDLSGGFVGANGEGGRFSGTIDAGGHIVITLTFAVGATAGYFETWDGNVNAAVTDFTGTATPGNGGAPSSFALHK